MQRILKLFMLTICLISPWSIAFAAPRVVILAYHNFDPVKKGSMTISTAKFEEQIRWLHDHDYTVIPLQELVDYLHGKTASIPDKAVVITADDGRDTVYKYMWPIVRKYNIPVTLFIYPSSISNASYAMTWDQLRELQATGLFDIQGHTLWHPNFKQERKRLSEQAYTKFVQEQLINSKKILDKKLGINVSLIAWPHGIFDSFLEEQAKKAGYEMAFSIEAKPIDKSRANITQPRYMIVEPLSMSSFAKMVSGQK